jgi:large subunit ribosomal protein L9
MKVILLKDVSGVGKRGEIKEVNEGYGRNFLIAKGFASVATAQTLSKVENESKQKEAKEKKEKERIQKIREDLGKRTFTVKVKVGEKNQVYGSIHEKELLERIKEKTDYEFEKHQIVLPKHIKELGEYEFQVKLGGGVIATSKLKLEQL